MGRVRSVVTIVAVLVLVASLVAIGFVGASGGNDTDETATPAVDLVQVTAADSLWPYTSRSRSVADRTLAITLLVRDEPDAVRRTLEGLPDHDWRPTNESIEEPNVTVVAGENDVELAWRGAHGGTRYTYLERDGEGHWRTEDRQLQDGTYLATRDHVRLYAPPEPAGWTAVQVHREYWDWFRLRHTVTDVRESRDRVLDALTDRGYRTGDRADLGGTVPPRLVSIEPATVLVGVLAVPFLGRYRTGVIDGATDGSGWRTVRLAAFVLALPLAIRVAGVLGELAIGTTSPKFVAAPLYGLLVLGLPLGVTALARDLEPRRAFLVASVAFFVAIAVDFLALGMLVPPIGVLTDRSILAVGLGVLAAGGAIDGATRGRLLAAGVLIWLVGILVVLGLVAL